MADEIKIRAILQVTNGSINAKMDKEVNTDQDYAGAWIGKQQIDLTAETLTLEGVSLPRAIYIENTDPNNSVDVGPVSDAIMIPMIRLRPGEVCVMPLWPGVVLAAQCADAVEETGGTDLSCWITYLVMET